MQITLYGTGDRSVGINPAEVRVEIVGLSAEEFCETLDDAVGEKNGREFLRNSLKKYFEELIDDKFHAHFDDECPDCGGVGKNNACINPNCISKAEDNLP